MSKTAYVFPGQGAQFVGMGKDLYETHPQAKELFEKANEILGFRITDIMFAGTDEELKQTKVTQPAVFLHSVIRALCLGDEFQPDMVAGHSLGEFSALVASGALRFEDGLRLVSQRAQAMQAACEQNPGTMAAILGLPDTQVVEVLSTISEGVVIAANFNCPGQIVIAGTMAGVEKAAALLGEAGARKSVILPVSAPFHSTLMQPAAEKLAAELDKVEIRDAKIPVVANVSAEILTKAADIKESLVKQAASPVKWEDCVLKMKEFGADTFVEAGPGKTLCGFNKRIDRKLTSMNVENLETLQKTLDYFKEVR